METPTKMKNDEKAVIGLNRTMQYGNFFLEPTEIFVWIRLNRTMQYGNRLQFLTQKTRITSFKSYYVVWKPFHNDNAKEDMESV